MLFLGPALLPGRTLSNTDILWFEPPWVSSKPAELRLPSNPDLLDEPTFIQPILRRAVEEMPHVALWNPSIVSGRPFHADFQSAVFSPYSLPAYVLGFWTALSWIGVLKLWVAALGTYLLGRALGMRFAGALLAGVVFAFSLRMVTWLSYTVMGVWTWLPWLLLLTNGLVRRPGPLWGAGLAAVVAIQFFTGHPESSFHVLFATGAFFALRLWQARRSAAAPHRPRIVRPALAAFAAAVLGGTTLAAVSLVPFLELLWHSADLRDRPGASVDRHLLTKDAIGLFLPDFWGRPTQTPIRRIMFESALYVGALPLMLAGAALILRPTATRVAVALFGGLWLAVVLGVPPFVQVVTRLPVFSSGHNTRLAIMTVLALALLAGWGLDELTAARRAAARRVRVTLAVSAALLALPLLIVAIGRPVGPGALPEAFRIAWLFADPPGSFREIRGADVIGLASLIVWLTLAGIGLLLLVLRIRGRLASRPFVVTALLLVCVDLFRAGVGFNPAIEQEHASVPKTPAIDFLERRPGRFVSTGEIPQNIIPMTFRLDEARGYDLPIIERYDRLWRREVTPRFASVAAGFADIPLRLGEPTPRALRTLRLLGVTHVLGAASTLSNVPPFDDLVPVPPLRALGLRLVYDGPDARVYRIQGALPRVWVADAQRLVSSGEAALDAIARPGFDARRTVVTERRLPGLTEDAAARGLTAPGATARLVSSADERVVVRARSAREGVVILNDVHFPGWKARVDGRDTAVERVDYVLRGVRIGPGAHTVEFRYEPLSWRIGWITTLASLAGLALAVVAGVRRSRGSRR